jgi:CubicO group peptidase (beta-lactamase class C family)
MAIVPLLPIVAACYPAAAPRELGEGVWTGSDGARRIAVEFAVSHLGAHATVHVLENGRKTTEYPAARTAVVPPHVEIRVEDGGTYTGRLDLEARTIRGEWTDLAGASRRLDLVQAPRADVPGLLARPATGPDGPGFAYRPPPPLGDGWQTATLEAVGIDPGPIADLVEKIDAGELGVVHSLLIARDDSLVLEEYFHGHRREDLHDIAGITQAVASLLVGIAIDRGRIPTPETRLLDLLPDWRARAGAGWERVTLEHLLTMTVARDPVEWQRTGARECRETPYHHVLTDDVSGVHGTRWRYGERDVNLLADVLRRVTGQHADRFGASHLFEPLAIEPFDWSAGRKEGFPMMHGTLRLRPRDLTKLGALVLGEGRWRTRRVVSAEWVRAATARRVCAGRGEEFGYLWRLRAQPDGSGATVPLIFAWGWGGQGLFVVPAHRAVIVVTGGNQFNGESRDRGTDLVERILAAVRR